MHGQQNIEHCVMYLGMSNYVHWHRNKNINFYIKMTIQLNPIYTLKIDVERFFAKSVITQNTSKVHVSDGHHVNHAHMPLSFLSHHCARPNYSPKKKPIASICKPSVDFDTLTVKKSLVL
jgi:hypothetical protein